MVRHAHGAAGLRLPDRRSNLLIGPRLAVGNLPQRRPHPLLKGCAAESVRKVKRLACSGEIFLQLAKYPLRQFIGRTLIRWALRFFQRDDRAILIFQPDIAHRRMVNRRSSHGIYRSFPHAAPEGGLSAALPLPVIAAIQYSIGLSFFTAVFIFFIQTRHVLTQAA